MGLLGVFERRLDWNTHPQTSTLVFWHCLIVGSTNFSLQRAGCTWQAVDHLFPAGCRVTGEMTRRASRSGIHAGIKARSVSADMTEINGFM